MAFVTPDILGTQTPSLALDSYLAVYVEGEEEAGDFRWLHLWLYSGGSFGSVIRADVEIPDISNSTLTASLQVIQSDPAGLVGDRSLLWSQFLKINTYDPVADVLATHTPFGIHSVPIWNPSDGWIYYLDNLSDSGDLRLMKIRADMTGDTQVSTASTAADFEAGIYWLTDSAFYALGVQTSSPFERRVVGKWPLDGSAPSSETLGAEYPVPSAPLRHGLPISATESVWLYRTGSVVQLAKFADTSTISDLWPNPWAEWADPGGGVRSILSLSTDPGRTEAVVYAGLADGGSDRGIIRTDYAVKEGGAPEVLVVSSNGALFPDFMFALD